MFVSSVKIEFPFSKEILSPSKFGFKRGFSLSEDARPFFVPDLLVYCFEPHDSKLRTGAEHLIFWATVGGLVGREWARTMLWDHLGVQEVESKCLCAPKQSHNLMRTHPRPRFPLFLKVGYRLVTNYVSLILTIWIFFFFYTPQSRSFVWEKQSVIWNYM